MAKAKRNSEYWKERMEALEDRQYTNSEKYYHDIQEQFRMAEKDIKTDIVYWYQRLADNNDISFAAAKQLLKRNELKEFHWQLEEYIKKGEENAVSKQWMKELENASAKYHISYLEVMKLQVQQHAELLSTIFEKGITEFLGKSYEDFFYHVAYEIAKGTSIGSNLAKLDTKKINTVIQKPWAQDGKVFSDRIWANKERLVQKLHTELTQSVIRGTPPMRVIDTMSRMMDVSKSQAGRLIMTESAAIASRAQQDCFCELGVERYEIVATLDSKTSEICQEMDGKVFDQKDYEAGVTAPPFHPWCRTTTAPYFDDEFTEGEQRAARDEKTGKMVYVPADMTYKEWHEKYVAEFFGSDIIKLTDAEQYALNQYVSFDFYPINEKLRDGTQLTERESNMVKQLDSALQKMPLYKGNISRSLYFQGDKDAIKECLNNFPVGEEICFKEFLSTTCGAELYNPDGEIQIFIEDSRKGRDITDINSMEMEVLYERKSKFKIMNVAENDGKYWILLEES